MAKVNLTAAINRAMRKATKGTGITVSAIADDAVLDTDPDLMPIVDAVATILRELVGAIPLKGKDGHQLFNRTGHFRNSIKALVAEGGTWAVGYASDRFQGERGQVLLGRLFEIVPQLKTPSKLMSAPSVVAAAAKVLAKMMTVKKG